jgi:fatty-acyl-CoA synthase
VTKARDSKLPLPDPARSETAHNPREWIAHWARTRGDRPALVFEGTSTSYSEFQNQTSRLAQRFLELGVRAGDRIAIVIDNHPAYLAAIFAGAQIGAIPLPVNTRLALKELQFILNDAEPALVLVDEASCDRVREALKPQGAEVLYVPKQIADWLAALNESSPFADIVAVRADDPGMLMYSSGTTGRPKGALLPNRKALFNSLNAELCFGLNPDDHCLVVAPLFHSLGLHILSLPIFHAGGCVVLHDKFSAEQALAAIGENAITYMGGVPTHYERMLECLRAAASERFDLSSLRFAFGAGAAVAPGTIRAFADFGVVLKQGYGQTETSMLTCLDEEHALSKAGSVGRALEHHELRVISRDGLAGQPADWTDVQPAREPGNGEIGEIVVRGPITMLGYWRDEQATRETLRDGWVLTGDLAEIDDEGFITLVGRSKEMFISGGENVYPAEVEAAYADCPGIEDIAVVAMPDPRWGEVGCAFVVVRPGAAFDPEAMRAWGSRALAKFKIPHRFEAINVLPTTASGKVQKHKLKPGLG